MPVRFGSLFQLGYVVPDLDAAVAAWLRAGTGPWYVIDPFRLEEFHHRNGPSLLPDVAIALSSRDGVQIELIHQRDETPTMYREFLRAVPAGGLQHLGYRPDDLDAALAGAVAEGWRVGQRGGAGGARFVYLDDGGTPGTVAELVALDERTDGFFAHVAAEAAGWDGSTRPVRRTAGGVR